MPLNLEKLRPPELLSLTPERTVFFIPVGALEEHGPHLPLGLDLLEAQALCQALAVKLERDQPGWTGILVPSAPFAIQAVTTRLSLVSRAHVLRDWLVDLGCGLNRHGFKFFVCVSGTVSPRQLSAIEEARKWLVKRSGNRGVRRWIPRPRSRIPVIVSATSACVSREEVMRSPFWPDPSEHGGATDTSMALAIEPALVRDEYRGLPSQERAEGFLERSRQRFDLRQPSYWGKPAEADPAKGQALLSARVAQIYPELLLVLHGANPRTRFRSLYGAFPPNQSFFRVWILVSILALLMAVWTSWLLGDLLS